MQRRLRSLQILGGILGILLKNPARLGYGKQRFKCEERLTDETKKVPSLSISGTPRRCRVVLAIGANLAKPYETRLTRFRAEGQQNY